MVRRVHACVHACHADAARSCLKQLQNRQQSQKRADETGEGASSGNTGSPLLVAWRKRSCARGADERCQPLRWAQWAKLAAWPRQRQRDEGKIDSIGHDRKQTSVEVCEKISKKQSHRGFFHLFFQPLPAGHRSNTTARKPQQRSSAWGDAAPSGPFPSPPQTRQTWRR